MKIKAKLTTDARKNDKRGPSLSQFALVCMHCMIEDIDIIDSPLTKTCSADGHSLRTLIYRIPDSRWT